MSARHREDFTSPVQLESLLEVPVKLILIEDLIREKAALATPGSVSYSQDKEDEEENDYRRTGNGTLCPKKCLFDCCATPSRWRNTDCFSNNSQFRTATIALPWHDSLAVIPVMQVENPSVSIRSRIDASANEDTDTDLEMSTKNSDDEKVDKARSSPVAVRLPLSSPSSRIQTISSNISPNDEVEIDLSKKSNNNDQNANHPPTVLQINPSSLSSSPPAASAAVSVVASTSAVLGKVTEKPTRFEDFIIAHCGSNSSSSANNTTNPNKKVASEKEHSQEDVIIDTQDIGLQGSNNSADDTLKLTFYNEGRKECIKEFRTTMESGGVTSGANDVRLLENQHGLQLSRVIRESGGDVGSEGNVRLRSQQQPLALESSESISRDSVSIDDNTQNSKSPKNANTPSTNSNNNSNNLSGTTASIITQPQQLRLTSSIIQNLNNINNNETTSNNSVNNDDNDSVSHDNDDTSTKHGRQCEGLQISRCQKEGNSVITIEGESNNSVSNMEITSESSLSTTTSTRNPPESEKGENENSIERHLQTYLTSLRYVKPAESGSESGAGQETETNSNKGRSPVISPPSRPAQTNIISPVVSPHISSPGSRSGPGTVASVVRMPNIQRVSPSQQASSLDSWPERTIARIPTRPFLRRNSTFELQQQQQHQQQQHHPQPIIPPRPPSYHSTAQQPRMPSATAPVSTGSASAAVITTTPLQSPPKRFKAAHVPPASPMMAHYQSAQSQQTQQQYQQAYNLSNKYSNVNNPAEATQQYQSRIVTNVHPQLTPQQQQQQQQQHHVPTITNSNAARTVQQQHHQIQAYNNLHHYNQRQSTQTQQQNTVTPSTAAHITQRPHYSPGNAQYAHQQQHQQSQQQQLQSHHQQQQQQHQQQQQYQANNKYQANSNPQTHQNQQQQLQFQRHLQESLLIASTAMASSSEPVDSSYNERLRRYCEFYHRQELDYSKLQEYYKKYGFYPWDILTARDESIIRQMRSQEQEQHQPEHYQYTQKAEAAREGHITNTTSRYEMTRRMEMENAPLQQHHQHQIPARTMNIANTPGRVVPNFSPSKPPTLVAQAAMVPGNSYNSAIASGRNPNITITPSIISPHASTAQNRYHNAQQLQQLHQQRKYEVHQQRINNSRYYQSDHHHNPQNYSHQEQQQARAVEVRGNTNYDIQNSPHYRNAYNQLAAAAAVVSAGTAAVVSQNQMRAVEPRPAANTSNPVRHLMHAQAGAASNRPVVMTVSDPVPAPPDAVPLNIHRQALEQVIKNNQAATNLSVRGDTSGGVGASSRDINNYRHVQGQGGNPPSPNLHHASHSMHQQQQARQVQPYPLGGRTRNEDSNVGGAATQHKEPLRVVPSPTLAHQTSVIRRIQQQESPPMPFITAPSHNRYVSDRPGISYRRLSSSGSSADPNSSGGGGQPTAFMYQQNKDMSNMHAQYQQQHHQIHQHQSSLSAAALPNRRGIGSQETLQANQRGTLKRRIIITDNNGVNQNLTERCAGVVSSPIPLIAGEEELVATNVSPSAIRAAVNDELPEDDDRSDSGGGGGWQYDHVVLLDKYIRQMLSDDENKLQTHHHTSRVVHPVHASERGVGQAKL